MARLIINGDLTVLAPKVVRALTVRSLGVEDIAYRCQTTKDTVRSKLAGLKAQNVVDHDGRRPRTWRLIDTVEWERTVSKTVGTGDAWYQRRFTPEEDDTIQTMRTGGASFTEIGAAIDRRRDVVKNRYGVLKLKEQEAA